MVPSKIQCTVMKNCSVEFNNVGDLKEHVETYLHYKCEPCEKPFKKHLQLREHQKKEDCNYLKCSKCGKDFKNHGSSRVSNYHDHINACQDLRPYVCELCGASFNQRSTWRTHMHRKHTEEGEQKRLLAAESRRKNCEFKRVNPRKFQCTYTSCDKSYTTNQKLRFHIFKHTGEKSECDICHKFFSSPASLQSHRRQVHKSELQKNDIHSIALF